MQDRHPAFWTAVVGLGLIAIGLIGPWAKAIFGFSISGLDTDDGKIVAFLVAVGAVFLLMQDRRKAPLWPGLLCLTGLAVFGITVYDWNNLGDVEVASSGWGLELCVIASLVVAGAAGFMVYSDWPSDTKAKSDQDLPRERPSEGPSR
jgi:hypothetical protein